MTNALMETTHVFEKAGLGKAPFNLIAVWQGPSKGLQAANPEAYNRAWLSAPRPTNGRGGGSCHYCGTGIVTHCLIQGSDGSRFFVGADCVEKTGDRGLIGKVADEVSKLKKARRQELDQQKCDEFAELMRDPAVRAALSKFPHPNQYFASRGKTLLDWADFMRRASGVAGTKKGLRAVKAALAA